MLNRRTMIAASVMTACGLVGLASAQPAAPIITLGADANGGATTFALGRMFAVALAENPSTGYTWHLQPLAVPVVGVTADRFVPSTSGEPRPGAGGNRVITFVALAPGTETLALTLQRSWEESAPPAETFAVTITVVSDSDAGR